MKLKFKKRDSGVRTQNSELRAQNPDVRTQNSELRAQDSELRTQDLEGRAQEAETKEEAATGSQEEGDQTPDEVEDQIPQEEGSPFHEEMLAYCTGAEIEMETAEKAIRQLMELGGQLLEGVFNPEALTFALKALNYDSDLEMARRAGVIEGRNENIADAFRDLRVNKEKEIPNFHGASTGAANKRTDTIFDVARGVWK